MSRNTEATDDVKTWTGGPLNYKEGFFTQLATDELAKGINEEVVRAISAKRNEPEWMLEFRLNAYHAWLEMEEPHWLKAHYDKLNYQDYSYYSAPSCGNCDDNCASEPGAVQQTGANAFLSKEVEAAFEQLGVPVREGKEVAVDAIFDSVSVATTYREKLAEQGIIFIDEIDKLTSSSTETQRVVGGKGVQQALLPLIEGCKVEITTTPKSVGVATFTNSTKIVNTSNILFICGGAFPDLEEIIKERLGEKNKNIGFLKDSEDSEDVCENPLKYVETQDLEKFGLIPELLGRLPVKAVLDSLTTDVLKRILVEPQGSLVSQYRKLFAFDGIDLLFEDEALDYIAQLAYKEKTGARSLRTIMEKYLNRLMYESPGNTNIKTLTISKEFLLNQQNLLIKKHAFG